jgi:hypothetical protein
MRCENCIHWREYRPIGGFLPNFYRGLGSCYPDGVTKEAGKITKYSDECTIGRFQTKEAPDERE